MAGAGAVAAAAVAQAAAAAAVAVLHSSGACSCTNGRGAYQRRIHKYQQQRCIPWRINLEHDFLLYKYK